MQETPIQAEQNTFNQQQGAAAFGELSQVKRSAKVVTRDINTLSNLLSMAASNGLTVKVNVEEGTEHTRSRQVVVNDKYGHTVLFYASVRSFGHTSLKIFGSVCYGSGGKYTNFNTVEDAIIKLRGIVESNRLK